ncbi:hypothetical protein C8Q79DRAFT_952145 [Trametes meyenii]|nr:hypothetical protein C8Q79DRAFT_952145 [Trametes meyenii]
MGVPLPFAQILSRRARLASLLSELRPTRFQAPLTRLNAHRIPTLWTLYRGILRDSPTDTIKSHMREFFRIRMNIREQGIVTRELRKAHSRWGVFRKAKTGDEHCQAVCMRYNRMIEGISLQAKADRVYEEELAWYERMRTRPIMTGGYQKPTYYHGPLPRLKPQPAHITGMITWRRKARRRRLAQYEALQEQGMLLEAERKFENDLTAKIRPKRESFEPAYTDDHNDWRSPIAQGIRGISKSLDRDKKRLNTPYPSELLEQIKAARREKIANKARERERERRGEITKRLLRRMRQSPPAHQLVQMSPRSRRMDAIARGASEVGYVGKVKRALGFKLRDPDAWKVELGKPENRATLDRMAEHIEKENVRRRSTPSGGKGDAGLLE